MLEITHSVFTLKKPPNLEMLKMTLGHFNSQQTDKHNQLLWLLLNPLLFFTWAFYFEGLFRAFPSL